jgi:hypothetical protein
VPGALPPPCLDAALAPAPCDGAGADAAASTLRPPRAPERDLAAEDDAVHGRQPLV